MNKATPIYNDIIPFTEQSFLQGYGFRVKSRNARERQSS